MRTPNYSLVARLLHWVVALFIFVLLCVGFYMTGLPVSPDKINVYMMHKSFGILVLLLVILRLGWRFLVPPPEALDAHQAWEKILAKGVHVLLYAALIAMPLSGWAMSSAGGFPAHFFGLFELPHLTAKNEAIFDLTRGVHGLLAWVILGLVALHAAGAFKHHFIDRDATLRRMTFSSLGFIGGGVFVILAGLFFLAPVAINLASPEEEEGQTVAVASAPVAGQAAEAGAWTIQPDQSRLTFTAIQSGQPFEGRFDFGGAIVFYPDHLDRSHVRIVIPTASIKTGSGDRDAQAQSADWFDAAQFPEAVFEARQFQNDPTQSGAYNAKGMLTIRGVAVPVSLPFALQITSDADGTRTAHMTATVTLKRLDFGIGQGTWKDTQTIGNEVKIEISLTAAQTGSASP